MHKIKIILLAMVSLLLQPSWACGCGGDLPIIHHPFFQISIGILLIGIYLLPTFYYLRVNLRTPLSPMPIVISHLGIIFCAFLGGHESLLNSLIPMISNLLVERIVGFIVLFLLLLLWFAPIFIAFRRSRQQKISR